MIHPVTPPTGPTSLAKILASLGNRWRTASRFCIKAWTAHEQGMETRPIYRAVVSAITAVIARQMNLRRLVLAILTAIINAAGRTRTRQPQVQAHYNADGDVWPYD
jgi:hypothetical protein